MLKEVPQPADTILLMEHLNASLVTFAQIQPWTDRDPVLAKVCKFVLQSRADKEDDKHMSPYFQRRDELSTEDWCVLWAWDWSNKPDHAGPVPEKTLLIITDAHSVNSGSYCPVNFIVSNN